MKSCRDLVLYLELSANSHDDGALMVKTDSSLPCTKMASILVGFLGGRRGNPAGSELCTRGICVRVQEYL
jgi:hypothetical protein